MDVQLDLGGLQPQSASLSPYLRVVRGMAASCDVANHLTASRPCCTIYLDGEQMVERW